MVEWSGLYNFFENTLTNLSEPLFKADPHLWSNNSIFPCYLTWLGSLPSSHQFKNGVGHSKEVIRKPVTYLLDLRSVVPSSGLAKDGREEKNDKDVGNPEHGSPVAGC